MHTILWWVMRVLASLSLVACNAPMVSDDVSHEVTNDADGEEQVPAEDETDSVLTYEAAPQLVIPASMNVDEIIFAAQEVFQLNESEMEDFVNALTDVLIESENAPSEVLLGDDAPEIQTISTCSHVRHGFNWYTVVYNYGGDPDYQLTYSASMSGWSWQGSGWYYVPLNPNAAAIAVYYKFALSSGKYRAGSYSYTWMVIGDRAINIGFGRNASLAGVSYAVYRQLCR